MLLLSLLFGCQCGLVPKTGPTPFEAMVYADRVGDTSSFGVRVRQRGPFEAILTTPSTEAPWIEVYATGDQDESVVHAVDVVLPNADAIELIKTYWIHPATERLVEQAPTGLTTWTSAPAELTIWYPANSTRVMLWEPVEPGAFTPRLTSRPYHKLGMLMPLFGSCEPHGFVPGPAKTITPYTVGPFDSAPTLSIAPDSVVWRSRGLASAHYQELVDTFTVALGEPVDGRWSCTEGEGTYTIREQDDGWVEVALTTVRR